MSPDEVSPDEARPEVEHHLAGKMPRVVASGSRRAAYDDFCTALRRRSEARVLLLVDSEAPVAAADGPWDHLRKRAEDRWTRPEGAADEGCHLPLRRAQGPLR